MPWVKLDDQFAENDKIDHLSDGAFRLHVAALCHCAKNLTDGFIRADRLTRLVPRYKASYIAELTKPHRPDANPLWVPTAGGYQIHDFIEYQKSRQWWKDKREKDAKRLAEWRAEQETKRDE